MRQRWWRNFLVAMLAAAVVPVALAGDPAGTGAPPPAAGSDSSRVLVPSAAGGGPAAAESRPVLSPGTEDPGFAHVPFGPGERLLFSINYGPVLAGEATLEVVDTVRTEANDLCYHVESRVTSNRVFSAFYKVRDRVTTFIDARYLYSRFFEKRLREGTYKKYVKITFDQDNNKAYYHDGRVFDTVPGIQDILSAFYYVRTLDLQEGRSFGVMTHSSRKCYSLEVLVHRRETVEVPAGVFDCFVVEPRIIGEGLFQYEGTLTIWLTADERRIPVLMKTKVKVGSIDASLKEFTLGQPLVAGR